MGLQQLLDTDAGAYNTNYLKEKDYWRKIKIWKYEGLSGCTCMCVQVIQSGNDGLCLIDQTAIISSPVAIRFNYIV